MSTKNIYAGYIRVSSEEQKREGLSLEYQTQKIREYVKLKEGTIHNIYDDSGKSGGDTNRKGFRTLMNDAKQQKFKHVIFLKLDRFSRNIRDIIITFDELNKEEISITSIKESLDTTTAMGRFIMFFIGLLAELERSWAKERTEDIHINKVEKGEPITNPPTGYKWNKKKRWVIDQNNKQTIIDAFRMATEQTTVEEICKELNIKRSTYYYILKNPSYIGIIKYKDKHYKGIHEPIITNETWLKINDKLPETTSSIP